MNDEILTIREVSELLKINEKTAYRLAAEGKLPGFKVGGSWRFERQEVSNWIKRQMEGQRGDRPKMITEYHAKLYAHELSKRHSVADAEKLAGTLLDAQVDLNPHQASRALRIQVPVVEGSRARRRSRPRQDHRGRTGTCSKMDRGPAAHPCHHARQPPEAVVTGDRRKVLPVDDHS